MKQYVLFFLISSLLLISCGNYDRTQDSISSGELKIGVDDSYSLMMASQIEVFEQLYKYAHITPTYEPEADVIRDLMNDSIQAAILNRPLSEKELEIFKRKQRFPESVKIAIDAIALIVHPENTDTTITLDQMAAVFEGKDTLWRQLFPASKKTENIRVVFDNNKSCNARFIKEKFLGEKEFPAHCFAVENNHEVIEYVASHKNAIGIISVSWISDRNDSTSLSFLQKIKVMGVIDSSNTHRPEMPRKPYQAYIFDHSYPLTRDVYAIRTGLKGTLGTGFVSHLAGEKGQLIIHRMGMVAAVSPVRTIKIAQ